MRDNLPKRPWIVEQGIVNLDSTNNTGTHWTAYSKKGNKVFYFDSFGNLKPPKELLKYLKGCDIYYNRERFQKRNPWNCGHLSLQFLMREQATNNV